MGSLVKLRKINHVILILLILLSCGLNLNSTLAYGEKKHLETNLLSLSSTLNDSIPFNESLQFSFDPVNHEIRYITWPHSAYPALVIQNNSLTLQLNESLANIYLVLINRELNYSFTIAPLDSSLSTTFDFTISQAIPAELYDILLYNEDDETIDASIYGQIILINCTNTHVSNQSLVDAGNGLYLRYCTNTTISDSSFSNNFYYGVMNFRSDNTEVVRNTFTNNNLGMYSGYSDNSIISENT